MEAKLRKSVSDMNEAEKQQWLLLAATQVPWDPSAWIGYSSFQLDLIERGFHYGLNRAYENLRAELNGMNSTVSGPGSRSPANEAGEVCRTEPVLTGDHRTSDCDEILKALRLLTEKEFCRFDVLNPCMDNRPKDIPGRHWAGGEACPVCFGKYVIAKASS